MSAARANRLVGLKERVEEVLEKLDSFLLLVKDRLLWSSSAHMLCRMTERGPV